MNKWSLKTLALTALFSTAALAAGPILWYGANSKDISTDGLLTPGLCLWSGSLEYCLPDTDGTVNQVMSTDGSGALTWVTPSSGMSNPMDSDGDLIYGGASGVATKLDHGTANMLLQSNGAAAPTWVSAPTGLTQLNVDSIRLNGTTLDTTAGNLSLSAAGGQINVLTVLAAGELSSSGPFSAGNSTQFSVQSNGATVLDGTADVIQMRIQGNATQTTNPELFVVENSAGTDLFKVTAAGIVTANVNSANLERITAYSLDASTNAASKVSVGDPGLSTNARAGIWMSKAESGETCSSDCAANAAGDGWGDGQCISAANFTNTDPLTCGGADAVAKICLCAGFVSN